MKKIIIYLLMAFFIFMFISSVFAFQIGRYDTHIKDEDMRSARLILNVLMASTSFFVVLFLFLKKLKIALIFIVMFFSVIIYNIIENQFEIDKCLDSSGAWNYPKGFCVTDNNLSIDEIKCLSKHGNWNQEKRFCEGLYEEIDFKR